MKRFSVVFFVVLLLGLASCTKKPKVSFTDESIEISVGETKKINYEITEGYEAEFILPNNTIASISGENITGVSAGEVELTVKVKGTEISATINVTVTLDTIEVTEVSISGKNSGLVGEMITLTATVLPANATDKTVVWSSSNETLATVTTGNVSLLKAGSVTITAKAGTKSTTHTITISDPVVDVDVESVTISGDSVGEIGDTITLTATVLPENATDKTVVWSSSDETLATVSNGVVTLLKVGAVTITARAGEVEDRHVITITDPIIAVESITISGETVGEVDEIITLVATVLPENATDKMVIWLSSDETLATVSDGVVTLLKAGNVTITAKNGEIETAHEITINESVVLVESITIAGENSGLVGDEITLTATVLPANATDKTIVWSSSDETFATVTDGVVTLLKAGNVTITASVGEVNKTHMISIENPIVNVDSVTIEGDSVGEMGDTITLTATV
ncbi:MAG: Ig-like domain-containing protein, partial [Acholeplasmataceae bacterium]|nr:Ig-like domain-containing protein [Acholeplasmataceae bacterium]